MGYDIPADHHGSLPKSTDDKDSWPAPDAWNRRGIADDGPQTREYWINKLDKATSFNGLQFAQIMAQSISRANRWHPGGITEWSALEWAGAMCGEAGECANAAKKLKRLEDGIKSINVNDPDSETVRHFEDTETAKRVVGKEVADTILYAVLVAARCGVDLQRVLKEVFNKKSEEYGFPERL